jgi:hypothetical protein
MIGDDTRLAERASKSIGQTIAEEQKTLHAQNAHFFCALLLIGMYPYTYMYSTTTPARSCLVTRATTPEYHHYYHHFPNQQYQLPGHVPTFKYTQHHCLNIRLISATPKGVCKLVPSNIDTRREYAVVRCCEQQSIISEVIMLVPADQEA